MNSKQLSIVLNVVSPKGPWNVKERDGEVWWVWKGDEADKPTEEQLQAAWDSVAHQYERQYDPIEEQLDRLWHAIDQGIPLEESDFYLMNKAVKDNNPKGA